MEAIVEILTGNGFRTRDAERQAARIMKLPVAMRGMAAMALALGECDCQRELLAGLSRQAKA